MKPPYARDILCRTPTTLRPALPVAPGTRFGPYEVTDLLGAGGMGEVYRARDTRLGRDVAVKVLPPNVHGDSDRRARFDREARAVSSLSHAHICSLYDVGHQNGTDYLVMELLDGESLADRLTKGPLPIDAALRYAVQIADALAAAHRHGVVHRDLKPGNVMLTKAGAKLLDFGLAKVGASGLAPSVGGMPTTPADLTAQGTILGTFQYMAPEQLEGREADSRTDIFAFGAMLYEMVTGRRAFDGRSHASLISAIMSSGPVPLLSVQPLAPPALEYTIARCLAKDPDERWQSAADLAAELKRISGASTTGGAISGSVGAVRSRRLVGGRVAWMLVAVLAAAVAALLWRTWTTSRSQGGIRGMHVGIAVAPADTLTGGFALSPDGTQLAFVGDSNAKSHLYLRALDKPIAVALPGTESASTAGPAFSPDGRWLAFAANGLLKRIQIDGSSGMEIAKGTVTARPAWVGNDRLVFVNGARGLSLASVSGGEPRVLTTIDGKAGEMSHDLPLVLPGNEYILFAVRKAYAPSATGAVVVAAQSLATGERRILFDGAPLFFLDSGELVFLREANVMRVPFNPSRLTTTGEPIVVLEGITRIEAVLAAVPMFSMDQRGSMLFVPAGPFETKGLLATVDRSGTATPLPLPSHRYADPRVSPDGTRLTVHVFEEGRDNWMADLKRGSFMKLTFDPGEDETPIWSHDGKTIVYTSTRMGVGRAIIRRAADGTGAEQTIWQGDAHLHLGGFTPDGSTLVISINNGQQTDIGIVDIASGTYTARITTPFRKFEPALSRNGQWLAYTSDESGRLEVYVQPFPGLETRWQVSTGGGSQPRWSRDGRELYYRGEGKIMVSDIITTDGGFNSSRPRPLFDDVFDATQGDSHTCYDVMPDGRFLMVTIPRADQRRVTHINGILNNR